MPARVNLPRWQDIGAERLAGQVPRNSVILYEDRNFSSGGRIRRIDVTGTSPVLIHSLHSMDFKDCLSSLRWNLDPGIVVTFFEDHSGGGRQYQVWGQGQDSDTHNNNFKDCASSFSWHRTQ
jgi:hypothetical protein